MDIMGIKELYRELEESERFYRSLIEHSAAPMCIVQKGKLVFINQMVEKILGYTEEELFNMNLFDLIHPEDREIVFKKYLEIEQGLKDVEMHDFRIIGKNRIGRFTTVARRIMYKGEPAVYVTGIEVTTIFSLYEELKKRNETLRDLLSQLKGNIDAMSALVDGIRNPLSIMLAYAELLGSDNVKNKLFEQIRRIDEIVSKIDQEWLKSEEVLAKLREMEKRSVIFNSSGK